MLSPAQLHPLSLALEPAGKAGETQSPLELIFSSVFRRLGLKRLAPVFQVDYRAFAGLRSTIRLRGHRAEVHISDLLAEAPPLVLEALAEILLAQVFRGRASREARECYLAYVSRPSVRRRIEEARRWRGSKRLEPPQGRYYDLEEVFRELNRRFFQNEVAPPRLGWSRKQSRAILGHYDAGHGTITISRWLDSPKIPRYVVEYLVFHEMLHMRYPVERKRDRRVVHSREFREAEKKFPDYEQARRRLKRICA